MLSTPSVCRTFMCTMVITPRAAIFEPPASLIFIRLPFSHFLTLFQFNFSSSAMADDFRATFLDVYSVLKSDLLSDPAFNFTDNSIQWIKKMVDYNVPKGKLNRGLSVIDSYKYLKEGDLDGDEIFLACTLGWCIEWLQAYFLVVDDIMDGSQTRRNQPCWFRLPEVGLIAINDGILLRNHISRILHKHFKNKPYYVNLLDLFNEVEFQTASGQMLDLITTLEGQKDLLSYSLPVHSRIVEYKTSYYSFYLPVACALIMAGENLEDHEVVRELLVEMGTYFQVQDDYLDCFGDPEVIGKKGTDIEEYKCSWLVVKALEVSNDHQKKILQDNYGKTEETNVALVKALYKELNLEMVDYNVPKGKLNRGLSVIDSYNYLKEGDIDGDEIFLACTLGWCIEWFQAYFLVIDDIMDGSQTRRNQPCWFRLPEVGLIAINDAILLRNHILRILYKHFRNKPYYVNLLDLFNEVEFQTAGGQMLDLITTLEGQKDISSYSLAVHSRIVEYKTSYYSFYLPVACALIMAGENLQDYKIVRKLLVEMGTYYQVQDDYLDCFGDPEVVGKKGTDIEEFKCSWLVVKALEVANDHQKKILQDNYGKNEETKVAAVKALYKELNLENAFFEYERISYTKLIDSIEGLPNKAVQAVLKSFLNKIYKRDK